MLPDVNVLIYAHREDSEDHQAFAQWLRELAEGQEAFALSELVLSATIRIVTNPRIFDPPTPLSGALQFCRQLMALPHCLVVRPGSRHWEIFQNLCSKVEAQGPLVADAYLAALAIEHGCQFITCDADFSRFPGLRWAHPLRV